MSGDTVCRRCYVSGRVQGVAYRASAAARARTSGVAGYARNLPDGRVEVLACGAPADVEAFVAWLRRGPPLASVKGVAVEAADEVPPAGFSTG